MRRLGRGRSTVRGPFGPFPLPALHPCLPRLPGCRVPAREPDRGDVGVAEGERPLTGLVEVLQERLGDAGVPVEDVADDLGTVTRDDRRVAAVVEGVLDDLFQREGRADLRLPALARHRRLLRVARGEAHGIDRPHIDRRAAVSRSHSRPVSVTDTVSANPRSDPNVWFTDVGSKPQCTMQSWHFSLPLLRPY